MSARVRFLDSTTEKNTTEMVVRRVLFPMGLIGKGIMTISSFPMKGAYIILQIKHPTKEKYFILGNEKNNTFKISYSSFHSMFVYVKVLKDFRSNL